MVGQADTVMEMGSTVTGGAGSQRTQEATTETDGAATAFTINIADLPDEQKTMVRAAGINGEQIVVTNDMKACAESGVGVARTQAIAGDDKPTMFVGAKLVTCYNR